MLRWFAKYDVECRWEMLQERMLCVVVVTLYTGKKMAGRRD